MISSAGNGPSGSLIGPGPNLATGGNAPTPSGQASDQTVSNPLAIDYLKVRCYLYKFTPNISFNSISAQALVNTALQQQSQALTTKAQTMITTLRTLETAVSKVDIRSWFFNEPLSSANTLQVPLASAARELLSAFINLPSVSSGALIVNSNLSIPFSSTLLQETQSLLDFFSTGGNNFGNPTVFLNDRNDLVNFLATAITQINTSLSSQQSATGQLSGTSGSAGALGQFEVSRFVYDLNTQDLSRFDLSRFISQYTTDQQLGNISAVGFIEGAATLQNTIIPLQDLGPTPGPTAVRRPIYFPNVIGDYNGYTNGAPTTGTPVGSNGPTIDPISNELVSTLQADELVTRIAMLQTLEDNGGGRSSPGYPNSYLEDVDRIEIAIRLRGIKNKRKRDLILKYFSVTGPNGTGLVEDELVRLASQNSLPTVVPSALGVTQAVGTGITMGIANQVATAQLQTGVTPLGLSNSLTAAQQALKNQLTAKVGDTAAQLDQLATYLTDAKVDGILLGDLVQKFDFFSIFIYKHEADPALVEGVIEETTTDSFFWDKESLFMVTPVSYFLGQSDNRNFATYSPEINGFIQDTAYSETPGSVNTLTIKLMGSMGLMGASKRIYNSTIFQGSVFDAAETYASDTFKLYQNLYADKNPLDILTILLDSLYLLRVEIPIPASQIRLTDAQKQEIINNVDARAAATNPPPPPDVVTAAETSAVATAEQSLRQTTLGGKVLHDTTGNIFSFFDVLSLRAFNQFGEISTTSTTPGALKGPKHLFNMASFLYANVMRQRRFNVRVASAGEVANLGNSYTAYPTSGNTGTLQPFNYNQLSGQVNGAFNPYNPNAGIFSNQPKQADGSGGSILEINPFLDTSNTAVNEAQALAWKSYFIFLTSSLGDFVADLKTPYEIMNDVVNSCYLELYETPGGRFIFRTPQYNNTIPIYTVQSSQSGQVTTSASPTLASNSNGMASVTTTAAEASNAAHMITSDDIIVISASYHQTQKDLVSKQAMGYGADLIGVPIPQLYYFYSNGKMVSQYGLNLGRAIVNPNVRYIPNSKLTDVGLSSNSATTLLGKFHYCRFFLEYSNMDKFTGAITAVGDPVIQAGRTYFDIKNQKFGYITHVTKNLSVGDTYTCTFTLTAVRDAVYGPVVSNSGSTSAAQPISQPVFRRIPEMEDFLAKFIDNSVVVQNIAPIQTFTPPPTTNLSSITSEFAVFNSEATANTNFNPPAIGAATMLPPVAQPGP